MGESFMENVSQGFGRDIDHEGDLIFSDDVRRDKIQHVSQWTDKNAVFEGFLRDAERHPFFRRKWLFGFSIGHKFDGTDHSNASDVTDSFNIGERFKSLLNKINLRSK